MDSKSMIPRRNWVQIKRHKVGQTDSGLYLPDNSEDSYYFTCEKVGAECPTYYVGKKVSLDPTAGVIVSTDDENLAYVPEEMIVAYEE